MLSEILEEIDENTDNSKKLSKDDSLKSLLSSKKAEKDYLKTFTPPPRKILLKRKTLERKSLPLIQRPLRRFSVDSEDESDKIQRNETIDEADSEEQSTEILKEDSYSPKYDAYSETTEGSTHKTAIEATEDTATEVDEAENFFNDGLDFSQIEEFESQQNETIDVETVEDNILADFLDQQDNFQCMEIDSSISRSNNIDSTDLPLVESDNKKVCIVLWS